MSYDWENNSESQQEYGGYSEPTQEPKKKKKKNGAGGIVKKCIAIMLAAVLFGGTAALAFQGVSGLIGGSSVAEGSEAAEESEVASSDTDSSTSETVIRTATASDDTDDDSDDDDEMTVAEVAEMVMPAMVAITNISVTEVQNYFSMYGYGNSTTEETESTGSGIIIGENDTELLIVTNYHVIEDATTLSVCFIDNEVYEAVVKGTDSDLDLAVISVSLDDLTDDTKSQISVAVIGDSDSLQVGEQVVAIGNALGYGQSVTTGVVSALNRQIDSTTANLIQTDAAINPGNSGGALLNMKGEVIGINSAKFASTEVEGMCYAIAISDVTDTIEDLSNRETRTKVSDDEASYLGISAQDVSSTIAEAYGIPEGIYITAVVEGSPADEAGLSTTNVITGFDGTSVSTVEELQELMEYYAAGETVDLTVQVAVNGTYEEQTITVTLGSASDAESTTTETSSESSRSTPGQDQSSGIGQ